VFVVASCVVHVQVWSGMSAQHSNMIFKYILAPMQVIINLCIRKCTEVDVGLPKRYILCSQ